MLSSSAADDGTPVTAQRWLVGAITCAAAFVGLYILAVRTAAGQIVDIWIFSGVQAGPGLIEAVAGFLRSSLPFVLGVACLVLLSTAVRQGRWRDIATAAAVVVVALPLSEFLQSQLGRPFLGENGYVHNTLPSGHVTAVAALGVAMVLLAPYAWRTRVAGIALVVVVAACWASVVGHAHRPSDVAASVVLVGAVMCGVLGAARALERAAP